MYRSGDVETKDKVYSASSRSQVWPARQTKEVPNPVMQPISGDTGRINPNSMVSLDQKSNPNIMELGNASSCTKSPALTSSASGDVEGKNTRIVQLQIHYVTALSKYFRGTFAGSHSIKTL